MDPVDDLMYSFVVIKPIGRAEIVIRKEQVYELNGPFQEKPAIVGILHAYGKKEEILLPIFAENYYALRSQLSGVSVTETEASPAPVPALKFETPATPAEPVN
jgi:hypothetical protein